MKKITLLFLLIVSTIAVKSQSISDLLDGYYAYNRFWGSVLVVQEGKILFQKSYGFADKDKNIMNEANTLFDLGSVTKTMTAAAILKLHDEGKLSVYDRVDKYIPGFISDKTDSITIINLLNHTSGMAANLGQKDELGNGMVLPSNEPITLEQLIAKFKSTKLKNRPGAGFEYNNYGYTLLAYIIEKVSGMDYLTYLHKAIFSKAGMSSTYYKLNLPKASAKGYAGIGSGNALPTKDDFHPSWVIGAGYMFSTTDDLSKFLQSLFSHQLFSEKTLKLMTDTCIVTNKSDILWSLGWEKQKIAGLDWYSHGGGIFGFSTLIGYLPEKNISVIILSNLVRDIKFDEIQVSNFSFVDEIAENIIKLLNSKDVTFLPVPKGRADMKHCGKYKLDDTHFMNMSLQHDSLFLSAENNGNFTLFDYSLNREINDTWGNYAVCKEFTASLLSGNFDGFEKYGTVEIQAHLFNKKDIAQLIGGWQYLTSQSGKYLSYNICNKISGPGYVSYSLAYHFEKSEVVMQLTFNDQGLVQGLFVTKVLPKCLVQNVNLVPIGTDEYFVDGYRYGGYSDFRIKYDDIDQSLSFSSDNEKFSAIKSK